MKKLTTKPRLNDNVEKIDNTLFFGRVMKILSNKKVKVIWEENLITEEKISDLALVRRI